MDEIEQKILEIESRNKKSNIIYLLAGISILVIVGSLIYYSNTKRLSLEKDREIIELQSEALRNQQLMNDTLQAVNNRYDSLKNYAENEINKLQAELLRIKESTNNSGVKSSISSIQNRVSKMDKVLYNKNVFKPRTIESPQISINPTGYTVRFYAYNPDPKRKEELIALLKKENYEVKVYPDWAKKPSFFSNTATILYYSDQSRKAAEKLRAMLASKANVKFNISKGAGLGISEKERKNTFIIHYLKG